MILSKLKLSALKRGAALRQCFALGKDFSLFNIAPLDPALGQGCGKHAGQKVDFLLD
jgi:hypothetical protein